MGEIRLIPFTQSLRLHSYIEQMFSTKGHECLIICVIDAVFCLFECVCGVRICVCRVCVQVFLMEIKVWRINISEPLRCYPLDGMWHTQ